MNVRPLVHVRERPLLDRPAELALTAAWAAGAGPGDAEVIIDIDSSICEVCGYEKEGAAYGYSHVLGHHPMLATWADTGEVLHSRQRKRSAHTDRGASRFIRETMGRARRAGATGPIVIRADSGVLVDQGHRRLLGPPRRLLDHRPPNPTRRAGRSGHRRRGLHPERYPDPASLNPQSALTPLQPAQLSRVKVLETGESWPDRKENRWQDRPRGVLMTRSGSCSRCCVAS